MRHWSWPRVVSLLVALVPVLAVVLVLAALLHESRLGWQPDQRGAWRITVAGLDVRSLLALEFVSPLVRAERFSFGLVAPLWGTILVTLVALVVALPVSLATAILSRELTLGVISRALGGALGMLSGIPPLVYALMGVFLMETFMRPKFGGFELDDARIKAAIMGTPQYMQSLLPIQMPNSLFLAGLFLALLIIPFIAPLIEDALASVPSDLKEASLGLGAGRWYTLTHVVLPSAAPGIVGGATLGALKAMGEVVIPFFLIGNALHAIRIPTPPWDVFERPSPLTAIGAGLLGGIGGEPEGIRAQGTAVAYFSGVVLLLLAFAVVALSNVAQSRLRSRIAP
jgi:phosphate transport system permease protein